MLTKSDIPKLLSAGLRTEFMKGAENTKTFFQDITTEVKSSKSSEEYAWLGENPMLTEWLDERKVKSLNEHSFIVKNKDFEATIGVDRNALEDDQYGQIKIRVQGMAGSAKKSYDKILVETVENGHATTCYDGQNFFDTDHSEGDSGTQSNYSASGLALSSANLKTVITNMGNYKDERGNPSGIMPSHIVVPTALRFTAKELLFPKSRDADRELEGELELIVNPYLANNGANSAWYVLDLVSRPVRPFIYQNRKDLEFVGLDQPNSPELFWRKKLHYGVDSRFNFAFGDWRQAYKAVGG